MAQPSASTSKTPAPGHANPPGSTVPPSGDTARQLADVAALLQAGDAAQALAVVKKSRNGSPWMTNAQGVCELRLGHAETAVSLFRGLVLGSGLSFRADAPAVFKANYATALFAASNLAGGLNAVEEMRDEPHPAAQRLRDAVQCWQDRMSWWQRLNWLMGGLPRHSVELQPPLGDLE